MARNGSERFLGVCGNVDTMLMTLLHISDFLNEGRKICTSYTLPPGWLVLRILRVVFQLQTGQYPHGPPNWPQKSYPPPEIQ